MDETPDQIERHIRETRKDLGKNIDELESKVKKAFNWRAQFEDHPGTMIAVAFGGGVLLSALFSSNHSSGGRSYDRWNEPRESENPGRLHALDNQASDTVRAMKAALIGVAATKLTGFMDELLPGFKDHFESRGAAPARSDPFPGSERPAYRRSTVPGGE